MRILQITPSYKPAFIYGGPIYSVAALSEALRDEAQVIVYTTTGNGGQELKVPRKKALNIEGVTVYYFPRWTTDHSHFSPSLLWRFWKTAQTYDVVHIHSWWNFVSVLSVAICLLKGIRPVVSPRGMLSAYTLASRYKKLFHKAIGKRLLNGVFFHATSSAEAEEINKLIPYGEVKVIFNLVNVHCTKYTKVTESNERLGLLFLSRIDPKKGLEILLDAVANATFPFHLTIAGTGDEKFVYSLKRKAEKLNISDRISWTGSVHGEKKFELYARNDLFILPSYSENFANVVIEALSVGTPVILSDQVGTSTLVSEHGLGWVCPPNAEAFCSTLNNTYKNSAKRDEIKRIAPTIIRNEFSKPVLVMKYLELYRQAGGIRNGR